MIISHKFKVIHIKLKKVAGSSFETALSKYCGPDDVLSEMRGPEMKLRETLGFPSAQNYEPFMIRNRIDHLSANEIRELIAADIFDNYLKIATIRNPYQKAISWYFWRKRDEKLSEIKEDFEEFIADAFRKKNIRLSPLLDHYQIHINGKSVVDFIIRYEHFNEDIKKLEKKIACPGLQETFLSINAKANIRPRKGTSLYDVYSKYPKVKAKIDEMYYKYLDKYELIREYWPAYKAELDAILGGTPK